jgi:hypothetical protein
MAILEAYPQGVPASARPLGAQWRPTRLGNGVVPRGLVKALADAPRPVSVGEAHAAVERLLGHAPTRRTQDAPSAASKPHLHFANDRAAMPAFP